LTLRLSRSGWIPFALFLLTLGLVVACQGSPLGNQAQNMPMTSLACRRIHHDAGQTEVCGQPITIVALSPYILDMMLSLGVEPDGYAAADLRGNMLRQPKFNNPEQQIPYIGNKLRSQPVNLGDRHSPSLEAIAKLQPDLILGEAWQGTQGKYSLLTKISPTVLVDDEKGGWQHSIEIISQALDKPEKLRQVKNDYHARIAIVREQLSLVASKFPQILLLGSGDLSKAIYSDKDSEFSRLLEELNFQLVDTGELSSNNFVLSVETIPHLNPDIIIVVAWNQAEKSDARGWEKLQQQWSNMPLLNRIRASQAGKVFFLDARLSTIRGPLAATVILDNYLNFLVSLN